MEIPGHADPSGTEPSAPTRIVGRTREQVMLGGSLNGALAGTGRLVLVSGEAGIGKSTILQWVAHQARAKGACVLVGNCYDLMTTPAYGPWTEVFRAISRKADLSTQPEASQFEASASGAGSQSEFFTLAVFRGGRANGFLDA